MDPQSVRALARNLVAWFVAGALAHPATAAAQSDNGALDLEQASALALTAQPLLCAQRLAVRGAREAAVAAAALPDPTLVGGLTDLAVTGPERYTLKDQSDTQFMLGIRQSFPGGHERALRGARGHAEAERLAAELDEQTRMVRREASLAWLDAWKASKAQALLRDSITEAERQVQAVDIAYRSNRATQADVLASRVSAELLQDALAGLAQDEWHARNQLRRWIGDAADRDLSPMLPAWPEPDADRLVAHLERHPHVTAQAGAVRVAQADVDLARAEYTPDWSIQAGYGYRPEFADYASLQFEIGLPVFTRNRQDRVTDSRMAELERAQALKDDWLRQHRSEIRLNVDDWRRLSERMHRYDDTILPQAQQRLDAALAGYGAGNGTLSAVLDARRSLVDIRLQRLALEFDAARHQVQLDYFAPTGDAS